MPRAPRRRLSLETLEDRRALTGIVAGAADPYSDAPPTMGPAPVDTTFVPIGPGAGAPPPVRPPSGPAQPYLQLAEPFASLWSS